MKVPAMPNMPHQLQLSKLLYIVLSFALVLQPFLFFAPTAKAVATTGYLRLDRMATSQTTGGTICLNPQTAATEGKVVITFPGTTGTAGAAVFGINQTNTSWTTTTTNLPTGTTAWVTIGSPATTAAGGVVTFSSGDLVVGTTYCFNFAAVLSTPTSAGINFTGTIQTQTGASAAIDTVNYATSTIANDQILVTATVPATFSMTLSGNTAALGSLTTTGAPNTSSAITMTVSTNALNGWLAWAKNVGANSTLTSVTTSDTTISNGAYAAGGGNVKSLSSAAGYGMSAAAGTGSPSISTEYAGSSTSFGSLDSTKFEQFASKSTAVSGNTVLITFGAEASAVTKAASDYTDTVTITAAGQF